MAKKELTDNIVLLKFLENVLPSGDGCLIWAGGRSGRRYGVVGYGRISHGYRELAHRFIYKQVYGEIPNGLEVDHVCGYTLCVNPRHLEAVSHSQNIARGKARRRVERWSDRLGDLGVNVTVNYERGDCSV